MARIAEDPLDFSGKTVIVTGAASGIGKACAESFLARGATVVGLDINPAIVSRGGCWVVDAHVVLTAAAPAEAALRRLV